jgi:transposase
LPATIRARGETGLHCFADLKDASCTGVDPQAYLTDVLTRLVNLWPASRLDELMPWAWAADRSENRQAA